MLPGVNGRVALSPPRPHQRRSLVAEREEFASALPHHPSIGATLFQVSRNSFRPAPGFLDGNGSEAKQPGIIVREIVDRRREELSRDKAGLGGPSTI